MDQLLPSFQNLLSFHLGGLSGPNFGQLKSEVFHFQGVSGYEIPEMGSLENFNHSSKLVHHTSLSHTTYVETNYILL